MTILNTIPENLMAPQHGSVQIYKRVKANGCTPLVRRRWKLNAAWHYLSPGGCGEITAQDFRFPSFPIPEHVRKTLRGIGVEVIRGLPIKSYSQEMAAAILYWHLGPRAPRMRQDTSGHVRDIGADPNDPNARIYQTSARQSFIQTAQMSLR